MNHDKYDTICCKRGFYLLICNELSCIDKGNQLLITTTTNNYNPADIKFQCIFTVQFNVFLLRYFLQCTLSECPKKRFIKIYPKVKDTLYILIDVNLPCISVEMKYHSEIQSLLYNLASLFTQLFL